MLMFSKGKKVPIILACFIVRATKPQVDFKKHTTHTRQHL